MPRIDYLYGDDTFLPIFLVEYFLLREHLANNDTSCWVSVRGGESTVRKVFNEVVVSVPVFRASHMCRIISLVFPCV